MHPALVRNVISPLLECLKRRRTFACARELDASQWWSPGQLRDLQRAKLRRLLIRADRRGGYYHDLLRARGLHPAHDDPFTLLAELPTLNKDLIRRESARLIDRQVPGGPIPFNTGGSTGCPLSFYVDRRRIAYDKAARMLTHAWFGARTGEREVYLWGAPAEIRIQDRIRRWRDHATNDLLLEAFDLTPTSMRRYLARMASFDPVSLFGYPSSLHTLAEFALAQQIAYAGPSLRAVFVTGECLLPHQRQTLATFFRVPVANGYGSRDGGFIAHECPDGGMHVLDQNLVVEILDRDQAVPAGRAGEIVLTHLDALAMPLIRYRTGDMGSLLATSCPCGRGMKLLGQVHGRRTDHLVALDGSLKHALAAIYVLRELRTVHQFQIYQDPRRHLHVQLVPAEGFCNQDEARIRTGLQRRFGEALPVTVRRVASIGPAGSGKHRHVVSDAVAESAARFNASAEEVVA